MGRINVVGRVCWNARGKGFGQHSVGERWCAVCFIISGLCIGCQCGEEYGFRCSIKHRIIKLRTNVCLRVINSQHMYHWDHDFQIISLLVTYISQIATEHGNDRNTDSGNMHHAGGCASGFDMVCEWHIVKYKAMCILDEQNARNARADFWSLVGFEGFPRPYGPIK